MPWLEELELDRVEGSTQYGKVRKLTVEQNTAFSHISSWILPSSLWLREHAIPPPPHGSQDKALGRRAREHDTSEILVPGPLPVPGREICSAINLCVQAASGKVMFNVTHAHLRLSVAVHACFNKKYSKIQKNLKQKKVLGPFWV